MESLEHPYNKYYSDAVYGALRVALNKATPGGLNCVLSDEAVDALLKLAVEVMAADHGKDDAKDRVVERINHRMISWLADYLPNLIEWHIRRTASAPASGL
jgi:hypothetical protein